MEDALRRLLAESGGRADSQPFRLHVHAGPARGLRADVSIDDNATLLDAMESGIPADGRR